MSCSTGSSAPGHAKDAAFISSLVEIRPASSASALSGSFIKASRRWAATIAFKSTVIRLGKSFRILSSMEKSCKAGNAISTRNGSPAKEV